MTSFAQNSSNITDAACAKNSSKCAQSLSQVRVGVRVRPLTASEISQGGKSVVKLCSQSQSVGIGLSSGRSFTFDSVFDVGMSQESLYRNVSPSLLSAFLEGYNATIMAYGQTGSGKTFTMGSEALQCESESRNEHNGLIPRFVSDIFSAAAVDSNKSSNDAAEDERKRPTFKVCASFLEVYGEELHDLLDENRTSLPLREDATGEVTVVGLKRIPVSTPGDALNVLHDGTLQRTTAATLMNHSSSRSHAVFTIYLDKIEEGNEEKNVSATISSSRFTFVDLAGSERMKRTGAEGERAREGIKINEGLLALGNVINALADEERLMRGEKVHVPYRQSKLTRLLQDALGGNSQTLFLACVSPSDTNASETLSTLQYANRARNIKNKPVRNIDPTISELKRLRSLTRILQNELVAYKFTPKSTTLPPLAISKKLDEVIFQRNDVSEYLDLIFQTAEEEKEEYSHTDNNATYVPHNQQQSTLSSTASHHTTNTHCVQSDQTPKKNANTAKTVPSPRVSSCLDMVQSACDPDISLLDINPAEDIAILDQLLELQHKDQEYEQQQEQDQNELMKMEGELAEQENLLLQLREKMEVYHDMKVKYETLVKEVQSLESQKAALAVELENAQVDPTKGCSNSIKQKLQRVESSLSRARSETRKHQQMYRKAEQEAKKCKVLERKINDLKQGKVALVKKQREAAMKHKQFTEQKSKEICILKKKERKAGLKVTKLEAECRKHKANLGKRKKYCDKLSSKLKETESHLFRVLNMRKRELKDRAKGTIARNQKSNSHAENSMDTLKTDETKSILFLLERLVVDRVQKTKLKQQYEERVSQYSEHMRSLVSEVKALDEAKDKICIENIDGGNDSYERTVQNHEENIEELELKIDLISTELEDIRVKLPELNSVFGDATTEVRNTRSKSEDTALRMVSNLSAPVTRTLLWDVLDKLAHCEFNRMELQASVERKDSALQSCENEIDLLNKKMKSLSKDFEYRRSISRLSAPSSGNRTIQFDLVKKMESDMKTLEQKLNKATLERDKACQSDQSMKQKNALIQFDLAKVKEEKDLLEAASESTKPSDSVKQVLAALQTDWERIGTSITEREAVMADIKNCLENTCTRKAEETVSIKQTIENKIVQQRHRFVLVCEALDCKEKINDLERAILNQKTLIGRSEFMEAQLKLVESAFNTARERREKIFSDTEKMLNSMDISKNTLSADLQMLLALKMPRSMKKNLCSVTAQQPNHNEQERENMCRQVNDMLMELEEFNSDNEGLQSACTHESEDFISMKQIFPPFSLSPFFLECCERDVKKLRLKKSNIIVQYNEARDSTFGLVKDMHMSPTEVLSLLVHSVKKETKEFPQWWDADTAEYVCETITKQNLPPRATKAFGDHLNAMHHAVKKVAAGRSALSDKLKELVDGAHKMLLSTVEGTLDTSEATACFHEALFRLPPLSKDRIQACIDEIVELTNASEAMSLSELEALTLVWEASGVNQNERNKFWSEVDEATKILATEASSPFETVVQSYLTDLEEWVLSSVKSATKVYKELDVRIFKLRRIHDEVNKFSAKQDAKSKIIALDSEIRIISAQLAEFEAKANNKSRLVSKKQHSSSYLKQERFRKHVQGKYAAKLKHLGTLLQEWEKCEGSSFDASILSEDVCTLLEHSSDSEIGSLIEERTAFMHLKTIKPQNAKKLIDREKCIAEMEPPPVSATKEYLPLPPPRSISGGKVIASPYRERLKKSVRRGICETPSISNDSRSLKIGTPPPKERRLLDRGTSPRTTKKKETRDTKLTRGTPLHRERKRIIHDSPSTVGTPSKKRSQGIKKNQTQSRKPSISMVKKTPVTSKKLPSSPKNKISNMRRTRESSRKSSVISRASMGQGAKPRIASSPGKNAPPSSQRTPGKTSMKHRTSKRGSLLPFENVLSNTPPCKENLPPKR